MVAIDRYSGTSPNPCGSRRGPAAAFTLLELLVVMGVISIFVGVIGFRLLQGGSGSVGLQTSQSILVGLLTQARSQAILSGRKAGLLVHFDLRAGHHPERYLRYVVAVARDADDSGWVPLDAGTLLPNGCVILPRDSLSPEWIGAGTPAQWSLVRSTALEASTEDSPIESTSDQQWLILSYTPRGTVSDGSAANIGIASIRTENPGSSTPFKFVDPENVRGIALSSYGQLRVINSVEEF